jgi:peptidoglycan hydrolase CwlO-like protein
MTENEELKILLGNDIEKIGIQISEIERKIKENKKEFRPQQVRKKKLQRAFGISVLNVIIKLP